MRLLLLLICLATPAYAGDLSLVINGLSKHHNAEHDYNEVNVGLGVQVDFHNHLGFNVGMLKDSFGYQARYAGIYGWGDLYKGNGVRLQARLALGAIKKQRDFNGTITTEVGFTPFLSLQYKRVGINYMYLPVDKDADGRGLSYLQFTVRLL